MNAYFIPCLHVEHTLCCALRSVPDAGRAIVDHRRVAELDLQEGLAAPG
jgi:hypothetical protein